MTTTVNPSQFTISFAFFCLCHNANAKLQAAAALETLSCRTERCSDIWDLRAIGQTTTAMWETTKLAWLFPQFPRDIACECDAMKQLKLKYGNSLLCANKNDSKYNPHSKKLGHCVKQIKQNLWFANPFWPVFNWIQSQHKISDVQTDKCYCFL